MKIEIKVIEEKEIITEEDIDESDPEKIENNENKKYDESRIYYVYEHIRLDKMEPFYIGKGKGERAYDLYRNDHHDAITDKYGHAVVIIADNLTEEEAYWLERDTIEDYVFNLGNGIDIKGHNDYDNELPHLTNMDWGGIGGKSGIKHSEEHNKKISEALKGENNPLYGEHHSEEHNKKISESMKGKNKGKNSFENKTKEEMETIGKKISEKVSKKVICITTGKIFNSVTEASNYYNVSKGNISSCCRGTRKSTGELQDGTKLQWKYSENDDNESKVV